MKLDFSKKMVDLDGKTIKEKVQGKEKLQDVLMKDVVVTALMQGEPNEKIDGDGKNKRFLLATDIHKSKGPMEIDLDDAVMIKKICGALYLPLYVGQVYAFIGK